MQKSTHEPGLVKQRQFISDCVQSGPVVQSARPPSTSLFQLQSMHLIHRKEHEKFHARWTFCTKDAFAPC